MEYNEIVNHIKLKIEKLKIEKFNKKREKKRESEREKRYYMKETWWFFVSVVHVTKRHYSSE